MYTWLDHVAGLWGPRPRRTRGMEQNASLLATATGYVGWNRTCSTSSQLHTGTVEMGRLMQGFSSQQRLARLRLNYCWIG